jgi:3' terminal RNA ribose 2'-O-methyltransferase Hen1
MTGWLHDRRLAEVCAAVGRSGARTVLDLGCGDGDLIVRLMTVPHVERIVGIDLSRDALRRARVRLDASSPPAATDVELVHGSMTEGDPRFAGFDCAILLETIEHIAPDRLSVLENAVFGTLRPGIVLVTTPNADFNPLLGVPPSRFRHPDHHFEWGRERFRRWAAGAAARNGYGATCTDLAGSHPVLGGASQMAVFRREDRPPDTPSKPCRTDAKPH